MEINQDTESFLASISVSQKILSIYDINTRKIVFSTISKLPPNEFISFPNLKEVQILLKKEVLINYLGKCFEG
jgi:hypothetical protein